MGFGEYIAIKTIQIGSRTVKKGCNRITDRIHGIASHFGAADLPRVTDKERLLQNRSIPIASMIDVVYSISNKEDVTENVFYRRHIRPEDLFPAPNHADPDITELLESPNSLVRVFRLSADEIVVAVRGTNVYNSDDLIGDAKIAFESLHNTKRVAIITRLVVMITQQYPTERVILAGHSLGAAIAFHIGRRLYLKEIDLEGHFFELPFMPLDIVVEEFFTAFELELYVAKKLANLVPRLRKAIEQLRGWLKEQPTKWLGSDTAGADAEFDQLNGWQPHIYVQKYDKISNGYIDYFKYTTAETPGRNVSRLTALATAIMPCLNAQAYHLCPSAILVTSDAGVDTLTSHSLRKWMKDRPHRVEVAEYYGLVLQDGTN